MTTRSLGIVGMKMQEINDLLRKSSDALLTASNLLDELNEEHQISGIDADESTGTLCLALQGIEDVIDDIEDADFEEDDDAAEAVEKTT